MLTIVWAERSLMFVSQFQTLGLETTIPLAIL